MTAIQQQNRKLFKASNTFRSLMLNLILCINAIFVQKCWCFLSISQQTLLLKKQLISIHNIIHPKIVHKGYKGMTKLDFRGLSRPHWIRRNQSRCYNEVISRTSSLYVKPFFDKGIETYRNSIVHTAQNSDVHSDNQRRKDPKFKPSKRIDWDASNNTSISSSQRNKTLYPPITAYSNGTIVVDSIHTIYYEEYGTNLGLAISNHHHQSKQQKKRTALVLHGGPGAGSFPNHARFFHPEKFQRIILFDQRGCGRSTPRGDIRNNTLEHLVSDIEVLRIKLKVGDAWDIILGGSWGCTLALAYAQTYPERVRGIVLRGVCLLRSREVNWLFGDYERVNDCDVVKSLSNLNPQGWAEFRDAVMVDSDTSGEIHENHEKNFVSENESARKVLHKYYDCLLGGDALVRAYVTKSWFRWEMGGPSSIIEGRDTPGKQNYVTGDRNSMLLIWTNDKGWSVQSSDRVQESSSINDSVEEPSQIGSSAFDIANSLRRWSLPPSTVHINNMERDDARSLRNNYQSQPRPIYRPTARDNSVIKLPANGDESFSEEYAKNFIPAQAMLTCYYSVNNEFMVGKFNLLSKERIDRIRHIPCISIQGGKDFICPPDTALDLHEAWPEMELRIVMEGKHSMYDPPIAREIVKATEDLADTWC